MPQGRPRAQSNRANAGPPDALRTLRPPRRILQVHANCRIRRIYFADRLYSEAELPPEFKVGSRGGRGGLSVSCVINQIGGGWSGGWWACTPRAVGAHPPWPTLPPLCCRPPACLLLQLFLPIQKAQQQQQHHQQQHHQQQQAVLEH